MIRSVDLDSRRYIFLESEVHRLYHSVASRSIALLLTCYQYNVILYEQKYSFIREDVLSIWAPFNRNAFTTLEFTTRASLGVVVSALAPTVQTFIGLANFVSIFDLPLLYTPYNVLRNLIEFSRIIKMTEHP